MIAETYDASALLTPPQEMDSGQYVQSIRAGAGFLLGKGDWAAQHFFGISVLEQAVKPLSGDWPRLEYAARGYDSLEVALRATSENLKYGAEQLGQVWQGEAAAAATATVAGLAEGHRMQAEGCKIFAEQLRHVCEVSKTAGDTLAAGLGVLNELLTQLLLENMFVGIGNVFSAITLGPKIVRFWNTMNQILDAIRKVMQVVGLVMQVVSVLQKLMGYMTTAARTAAGTYMDDTARAQFGA